MPDTVLPLESAAPVAVPEASPAPPAPSVPDEVQLPVHDSVESEPETAVDAPPEPPAVAGETPDEPDEATEPSEVPLAIEPESNKRWYVVKVQSGREDTIKEAIERRVKIEALEEFYGEIIIPTETVIEVRRGKRVKKEKKLYPGYIMARVEYNDRVLYLFRETSGVGDFVGGTITRPPPPMSQKEIDTMLRKNTGKPSEDPKVVPTKPEFSPGDRVKVKDGAFAGMEGEVKEILEAKGQVRVEVAIFGRPVSLELEYWQVEQV